MQHIASLIQSALDSNGPGNEIGRLPRAIPRPRTRTLTDLFTLAPATPEQEQRDAAQFFGAWMKARRELAKAKHEFVCNVSSPVPAAERYRRFLSLVGAVNCYEQAWYESHPLLERP